MLQEKANKEIENYPEESILETIVDFPDKGFNGGKSESGRWGVVAGWNGETKKLD